MVGLAVVAVLALAFHAAHLPLHPLLVEPLMAAQRLRRRGPGGVIAIGSAEAKVGLAFHHWVG
jgi:hypothetical protein